MQKRGLKFLSPDNVLAPLQAATSAWRIAQWPRAGRKVLSIVDGGRLLRRDRPRNALCADAHGFNLHTGVCQRPARHRIAMPLYHAPGDSQTKD